MRVTLVSPFDPRPSPGSNGGAHVGGVERVFGEISRALAARGHDVTLVCSSAHTNGSAVEDGVRVVRARRHLTILRAPLVGLSRHVPTDAQIVHVAATYPFTTPRVLRRARALKIPSVLDFHFEPGPGTPLGRFAASLYRHLGPRTYLWADAVLVRSVAYGQNARSLTVVPQERWRVVPNGIDTRWFRPVQNGAGEDYLLFVGRLVPYKGVDVLLRALAYARPRIPLYIVGDGPLRKKLESQARALRVDARFLGHVPDEDLPRLYSGALVTILPSVTPQEAFGLALLESMACGTPVVASSLPGVEELALMGGLVAPPGDPVALAEQIRRAMRPGLLPKGQELVDRVRETYSWDAVTDRLVAVYEEVLDRRNGGTPRPREVTSAAHPGRHPVL